jgi:phosphate transport system substrate-binding protein
LNHFKRILLSTAVVLCGSTIIATAAAQASTTVSEAGSTLVFPLVQEWGVNFGIISGDTVTSAGGGSGAGITDVCGNTIDIGASDAPLGYPGVKACGANTPAVFANYYEIPWALSATGIIYKIPVDGGAHYITNGLHLTAADLVGIYTGKITEWSQLQSQQHTTQTYKVKKVIYKRKHGKRVKIVEHITKTRTVQLFKYSLPSGTAGAITPVYRSDGSGDSYAFTNFMSKASSTWNTDFGPSTSFPTTADASAIGESGNSGVAAEVEATNGSIGYVSNFYSITVLNSGENVAIAKIGNKAGNFEYPNVANIDSAASSIKNPPAQNTASTSTSDLFGLLIQYPSKSYKVAYPISTYTYAIVPTDSGSAAAGVQAFLTYAVSKTYDGNTGGLNVGDTIGFAPLPSAIQSYDKTLINKITS